VVRRLSAATLGAAVVSAARAEGFPMIDALGLSPRTSGCSHGRRGGRIACLWLAGVPPTFFNALPPLTSNGVLQPQILVNPLSARSTGCRPLDPEGGEAMGGALTAAEWE